MKINKIIIISALAVFICAGCDNSDKMTTNTAVQDNHAEVYEMQEGDSQVSGEVISIVGNEVTLALGEVNERETPSESMPESSVGDDSGEPSLNERPSRGNGSDFANGEKPDPSSFEKNRDESGQFGNKQRSAGAVIEKSGDTAAYIIPVGMTVSGVSGHSSDYSGISEGDILTLIIDSEGTVKSAEVR